MTLARLYVLLDLNSGPFRAGMTSAISQISALQRSVMGLTAGQSLSSLGRSLTYGLTIPIIAAGVAIGTFGSQLSSEMARVQSVIATPFDNKAAVISQWTDDVQALGVTLGRTSPEVTNGLYEIVSAFGELPNTMDFLTIAGRSAVAGQSDIATSTRNLALMTRAWGDSSTEAVQRMADLGSATVRVGTLTESEMGGAMAGLLPIMKLYNVGLGEGFAGLASLAGVSGTASQASTQLQRAITSIVAPNTALTKAYKVLGIESGEALLQQKGLLGAFETVQQISEATGIPLQKLVGRIEGVKAIATLTGPQLEAFNDNLGVMANAAGDVDRAFAGATDGIYNAGFQWAQATQRLRVIAEDLYIAFAPAALNVGAALQPAVEALQQFAQVVAGLDTGTLSNVLYGLLGLAALGPVLSVVGSLTSVFSGLYTVLAAVNPWVWAVAAAGGALWLAWNNNWGNIQGGVASLMDTISQRADNARQAIENLQRVWDAFTTPKTKSTDGPVTTLRDVTKAAGDAWRSLGPVRGELSHFEQQMIQTAPKAQSAWSIFVQGFRDSLPTFQGGGGIIRTVGNSISTTWQILAAGADVVFAGITKGVSTTVKAILTFGSSLSTGFLGAISAARSAANGIMAAFKLNWGSIGSAVASGIASGIRAGVGAITSAAVSAASAALSAAKSALGINSPSTVFRNQVGRMIPAGMALGISDGAYRVQQALGSLLLLGGSGGYGVNLEGRAAQMGIALAGAGGSTTINNVYQIEVTAGPGATQEDGENIAVGITKALRSRGLI